MQIDPLRPIPAQTPMERPAPNLCDPVKKECGAGVRGQALKNVTGVENEVGTPRQLPHVTNIIRCSCDEDQS